MNILIISTEKWECSIHQKMSLFRKILDPNCVDLPIQSATSIKLHIYVFAEHKVG